MTFLKKILQGLFRDDFEAKNAEIQSLKDSLDKEKRIFIEKDSLIHRLQADIFSLRQEIEYHKESKDHLEAEISRLRLELKTTQEHSIANRKEFTSLNVLLERSKDNALREEKRADRLMDELATCRKELSNHRRKLSTLQREYDSIVVDFDSFKHRSEENLVGIKSEHQAVSEQLDAVKSEKDQLQFLIGEYLLKISELEERYALESESHERALASLRSQVEDRNHEIDTKEDEIEKMRVQLDTRDDELSDLRDKKDSEISDLSESLRKCQDSLQAKTDECESLKAEIENLRVQLDTRESELSAFQQEKDPKISELTESLRNYQNSLQSKIEECESLNALLSEAIETERSLSAAQHTIGELEQRIISLQRENDLISCGSEIDELKRTISKLESEIEATKATSYNTSLEAVEILPNNRLLYSNGKDWYLYGINTPIMSFSASDEVKTEIYSETEGIYRLTIEKYPYEDLIFDEFVFFGNHIFKKNKSSGKWNLWYSNNEKITDKTWDEIEITSDNQLKLSAGENSLILFCDGTIAEEEYIDEPEYIEKIPLKNGYFIVKQIDGFWGILDDKSEYAVLPQYDLIEKINEDYLKFQTQGKWGIMSIAGEEMSRRLYTSIELHCDDELFVTRPNPDKPREYISDKFFLKEMDSNTSL